MDADLLLRLFTNPCGMLAVGLVMYVAGDWSTSGKHGVRQIGAGLAGLALIAVVAFGILRHVELFTLAIGSAGFGLAALGTFWIVLAIVTHFFAAVASAMTPPYRPPEPIIVPQPVQQTPTEPPPPPPKPTKEELMAAAQKRYDTTLQLLENAKLDATELKSAQEQAKQQYLRDVDEAMK
jgi:hypothetical protein